MRPAARVAALAWRQVRFGAWRVRIRLTLARRGVALRTSASRPPFLERFPRVTLEPGDARGGSVDLVFARGARLRAGLEIEVRPGVASTFRMGEGARIGPDAHVKLRGGTVTLAARADLRDFVILKATGDIAIGTEAVLSYGTIVSSTERVTIGDRVGIGERTTLIDSDHGVEGDGTHYLYAPLRTAPIELGANTLVSANSVILRGVVTGHDSVVAAASVVRRGEYPPRAVLAGSPATVVSTLGAEARSGRRDDDA